MIFIGHYWQGNTGHHKGLDRANPVLKGLPPLTLPSGKAPLPPLKPVATAAAVPQDHGPTKKAGPIMSMKFGPGPPPGEWTPPLKSEPPFAKSGSGSGSGALASKAGSEPLQAKSGSGPLPMKSVSGPPVLKAESRPSSAKLGSGPLQSRGGVSQTGIAAHRALSDQPLVGTSVCASVECVYVCGFLEDVQCGVCGSIEDVQVWSVCMCASIEDVQVWSVYMCGSIEDVQVWSVCMCVVRVCVCVCVCVCACASMHAIKVFCVVQCTWACISCAPYVYAMT